MFAVTRGDIVSLIKGQLRPTDETTSTGISPAISYLITEKPASPLVLKHEDEGGKNGDGLKALQELVGKYNNMTDEVICATVEKLANTSMKQGQDPEDYFMETALARAELEKMAPPISDRRFEDFFVQGFTTDYKDIRLVMYRDPTFDVEQIQSTMRHRFLDLSRSDGEKGVVAGRVIAMTLETSTCHKIGKKVNYPRNCKGTKESNSSKSTAAKDEQKKKESSKVKTGSKDTVELKWCLVHKTTSHDDAECHAQGTPRPLENDNAHI